MKCHIFTIITFVLILHNVQAYDTFPCQAILIIPIADLVGAPLARDQDRKQALSAYETLPICAKNIAHCLRVHQLLFNEVVTLLEQRGDEVLVRYESLFYELEKGDTKGNTYWSLRKNFITVPELLRYNVPFGLFPQAIYYNKVTGSNDQKIIVLTMPFFDSRTKRLFSVGTRFVYCRKVQGAYEVFIYEPYGHCMKKVLIPCSLAYEEDYAACYETRLRKFITLLRQWIGGLGIIPYVWGGASFTQYCLNNTFYLKPPDALLNCACYERPRYVQKPLSGFDCTGLVARAAQICCLPYYYKNSTTVRKYLKPCSSEVCVGDIIWIPGHIMVVSDIQKNMLIEARGYNHGFGKVHEIPLGKVFRNMLTYDHLYEAYKRKEALQRLNSQGEVVETIAHFELLSLKSICSNSVG